MHRRFNNLPPDIIPPLREVYDDLHEEVVILKAAQVFISEYLINLCLWATDTGWGYRGNALYVMPNQTHMDDFSQARVQSAIDQSPRLSKLVTSATGNRVRLRNVNGRSWYFRGSETVAQIRTIDADVVINDEVDLFTPGAIEKSKERLGSSRSPLFRAASQPTYPEVGIDILYRNSDKRKWFIKCERCNKEQTLTWDDNVVFNADKQPWDVRIICRFCKRSINTQAPGRWEAENPGHHVHGYHISKLYSPRANLIAMLDRFLSVEDIEKTQSFYTADLGIPYRPRGSKNEITDFVRDDHDYWQKPLADSYMGVDIGQPDLNVTVIGRPERGNLAENPYYEIDHFVCTTFEELEAQWQHYQPKITVVDARGDPRATQEWVDQHPNKAYRWDHVQSKTEPEWPDTGDKVRFDRTSMLDMHYMWLRTGKLILHAPDDPVFVAQITALVREVIKNNEGRLIPRYIGQRADHYAFSNSFAIMAAAEYGVGRGGSQVAALNKGGPLQGVTVSSPFTKVRPRWTGESATRKTWSH